MPVHIDFETRSTRNLNDVGVYVYARCVFTDVWCMAWAVDDEPPHIWMPGDPFPEELRQHVAAGDEFWAHNANFERIIWRDLMVELHDFPPLDTNQWHCSAAQCAAMGLPRKLDLAAEALGLQERKTKGVQALAVKMAKPRKMGGEKIIWWDDPVMLIELCDYCAQDVVVERAVAKYTRRLSSDERETYLLDQRMNDRGIAVDTDLVRAAKGVALEGITRANTIIAHHTNGDVERVTQVTRMQSWLVSKGVPVLSLAKANVADLLAVGDTLPDDVRHVLQARSDAGRSSIAKLDRMLDGATFNPATLRRHLQGLLLYHGAHTGRWAARRVQPQNFPRPNIENPEYFIEQLLNGTYTYDILDLAENPIDVIVSLLRSALIPSINSRLMVADFKAIEAIVLTWLAGQQDLLARFAAGENVYKIEGETVGATRQHGKAIILGCGFGMGLNGEKFVEMSKTMFGLTVSIEDAQRFVRGYRDRYPKIPQFWYALQKAFMACIEHDRCEHIVGRIRMMRKGRYLWVRLPSDRILCYLRPELAEGEYREISIQRTNPTTGRLEERRIWGGLLAENVTQAIARDVMVEAMKRLDRGGYNPVLTVHDEIVCDVPDSHGSWPSFKEIIERVPGWADGLPVFMDGYESQRYRKD